MGMRQHTGIEAVDSKPSRSLQRLICVAAALLAGCGGGNGSSPPPVTPPPAPPPPPVSSYSMSMLVSDGSTNAATVDADLLNPWGIVFAPGAPVWIANNGSQTSTLYDGTGLKQPLVVNIPAGLNGAADATGIVFNGSATDFLIGNGTVSAPARFIFDGEGGTIAAWAPSVDIANALVVYDDGAGAASYKGLAVATDNGASLLYATDFRNNKVDVFDTDFQKVVTTGGFVDPALPAGYAPFGIQALVIDGETRIYVSYAQQVSGTDDNANGAGLGLVNVFDTQGTLQSNLIPVGGRLDSPWGMALAPEDFGTLSNTLLIGNFGDGIINAYDPTSGAFVAAVADAADQPIANAGLWGIAFGNGARNQPATTLYFAAGIGAQAAGLYGRIDLGATAPDIVAPTISITAPLAGATVSGTTTITVSTDDNVGVASVEFFADAAAIGTVTAAPFSVNWDSGQTAPGPVSLTAVATDAAANATTSTAVAVTVAAAAPPAGATLTQLQAKYFGPICSACHDGSSASLPGAMNLSSTASSFAALVNVPSLERSALMRVKPGDSAGSYLIHKLQGVDIDGSRMPLGGTPFTPAEIDEVASWIDAGAAND